MDAKTTTNRVRWFRLLADENRLRIIETLFNGPQNVTALVEKLALEQSLVSHHLASLRREGLVHPIRKGRSLYYELSESVTFNPVSREIELSCCRLQLK